MMLFTLLFVLVSIFWAKANAVGVSLISICLG